MCPSYMPEAHISLEGNQIGAMVVALAERILDATPAPEAPTVAEATMLAALASWAEGRPLDVLRQALGVTHSRTVRVADALEARGLVRRRRGSRDARTVLLELTPAGRQSGEAVLARRATALEPLLAALDARERQGLAAAAESLLGPLTGSYRNAPHVCRLCDAHVCHDVGRCPVTRAADATRAVGGGSPTSIQGGCCA
jgi:MarR family transcriptional regulator, negative regulator of the multidrug operon emrRAB